MVHPLLVANPRELLLLVPKEVLSNGLRGVVDLGNTARGVVGEVGGGATGGISDIIQLMALRGIILVI